MPNSLRCKIKHLRHNGTLTERECDRILKALEQKWIPCAEMLPKTNDIYLVSMHSYGLPTRGIDGYIQQTEKWEVYGNKVIAWMPLPEPYKAESEDEE